MPFIAIEPGQEMPGPGVCVLCESSRSGREKEDFFVSEVGQLDDMALGFGRKIVCSRCAEELGHQVGMERGEDVEQAKVAADEAVAALKAFRRRISDVAGELVDAAAAEPLPVVPEPKARKRFFG